MSRQGGLTLIEVIIASLIAAVAAVGTATAVVAAARMARAQSNPGTAEATVYARETAERFRNNIACDSPSFDSPWYDAACQPTPPAGWQTDTLPASAGTESILALGARRCYQVTPQDCDGVGGTGDCLAVQVRVCWNNDFTNCPCG